MSDLPANINPGRNLPSTYQEVLRHSGLLDNEVMPVIELMKKTILNPGDDEGDSRSDVIVDEDGNMQVVGITVVLDGIDKDTSPDGYLRDVTYELKNAEVIGLAGKPGVSLRYVTLKTVNIHKQPEGVNYPAWQCAYGDERMEMWYRQATSDNKWGEWKRVIDIQDIFEEHPEIVERFSHRQIVESQKLPTGQEVGDYWFWPIVKGVDPLEPGGEGGGTDPDDPNKPLPEDPFVKTGYILQNVEDPDVVIHITQAEASRYRYIPVDGGSAYLDTGTLKEYKLVPTIETSR